MKKIVSVVFLFSILTSCKDEDKRLFHLLNSSHTGINFSNNLTESDTLNILNEEYIYNGGGIATGDFNNDGLPDLFFTGNMVDNKLYLNEGKLKFKDVSEIAGILGEGKWCSGVTVVDINQDGWLDLYVSATINKDSTHRKNLLYVNEGLNDKGIPTFKEAASQFGIDDSGNTTQAAFFDYDNDGDLDLYLLTNVMNSKIPTTYRTKHVDGSSINNDKLFRNNGNGTFTNVSKEAGILIEGYGLGITISDINLDGWLDIYITNDYLSNDLLYINNQDGTFSNKIDEYLKHQSFSAMGVDVVDINNDGLVDIIALDMLPESNERKKQMLGATNYTDYINNTKYNFQHQYVRNTLQLNNGFSPSGHPTFSEIGQYANIYQTDWSWAPLVADFDNDGFRDIIATNGFPKDVTDRDFSSYRSGAVGNIASQMLLNDSIPVVKISNYGFRNNGNLTFSDKTKDWGLDIPSFSNGAIYVDLDNDGDLDVVVNNINDKAFVYKNTLKDNKTNEAENTFLRIKLEGEAPNLLGVGAKLKVYSNGNVQFFEQSPVRGYLSSIDNIAHFGLASMSTVDSIEVWWPNGKFKSYKEVAADQVFIAKASDASFREIPSEYDKGKKHKPLVEEVSKEYNLKFKHEEEDRIDFNLQRTIPHKYTQSGPGISVGDINNDGLEDFFIGGPAGKKGTFFIQDKDGKFNASTKNISLPGGKYEEDMGSLFFDADNDGALDLYIVSGSIEAEPGSNEYQDRLYLNDGKGNFTLSNRLPRNHTSGSCVKAADFTRNGFLDLFVGGRVVPGAYPQPAPSSIYRNENGRFVDITDEVCPELKTLGMVTDAIWSDFDNDGATDLIVVGEFLPVTFFKNVGGKLENVTSSTEISDMVGWYNSIAAADFDNDGDIDYVVGNLGLNTHYKASQEQPLSVYAKDFDNNESMDAILVNYIKNKEGKMEPYPLASRDDMISQMVHIRRKFPRYEDYGKATIYDLLSKEEVEGALVMHATHFASSYIENLGNGKFKMATLPKEAQMGPVFGILPDDVDGDGNTDILLVGNNYATEVFTGRYDAMIGLYLKGDGKGNFAPQPVSKSGFFVDGDAKGLVNVRGANGEDLLLVTQNQDSLKVFSPTKKNIFTEVALNPLDASAEIINKNGSRYNKEFYYGHSYLSQSPRRLDVFEDQVKEIIITDFAGNKRTIDVSNEKLASKLK